MPMAAIRYVGPTLQEDAPTAFLQDDVQTALQPHKISPRFAVLARQTHQGLGSLSRSLHEFRPICGRVTHAAVDLHANHLELTAGIQHRAKFADRFTHRRKLRPSGAAHHNLYLFHMQAKFSRADCTRKARKSSY